LTSPMKVLEAKAMKASLVNKRPTPLVSLKAKQTDSDKLRNSVLKKKHGSFLIVRTKLRINNKPRQEKRRPRFGPEVSVRRQGLNHRQSTKLSIPRAARLAQLLQSQQVPKSLRLTV